MPPDATTTGALGVRRQHERRLLELLADGPRRVAELAESSGLTKAAVGGIMRALVAKGWVREIAAEARGRGRPAVQFGRVTDTGHVAGVDVGAHRVRVVVTDLAGHRLAARHRSVPPTVPPATRRRIAGDLLAAAAAEAGTDVAGLWLVGLAVTGTIDEAGVLRASVALPGWVGLDLSAVLPGVDPALVVVVNDVRAACWAEFRLGAGRGSRDVLFVSLGRRPTASLVVGGAPVAGARGLAGDLSRSPLLPPDAAMPWFADEGGDAERERFADTLAAAQAGEPATLEALRRYLEALAPGVSLMAAVIDPQKVVVVGPLSALADVVLPVVGDALAAGSADPPELAASSFDEFAAAHGAALLALERLDDLLLDRPGGQVRPLDAPSVAAAARAPESVAAAR